MGKAMRSSAISAILSVLCALAAFSLARPSGGGGGGSYCCWYTYDWVASEPDGCGYYGNNGWYRSGPWSGEEPFCEEQRVLNLGWCTMVYSFHHAGGCAWE